MFTSVFLWMAALLTAGGARAAAAPEGGAEPVSIQLQLPQTGTHVIGDAIPFHWTFSNRASTPLALLWEGCCRLNGRVIVEVDGQPIVPRPPGSSLAHRFAKAERLVPGVDRTFETLLGDWLDPEVGGQYSVRGSYTGVLSNQVPQIARGLELWRGTSTTPPVSIRLHTPREYLQQREQREAGTGLSLRLLMPTAPSPLAPETGELVLRTSRTEPLELSWPSAFNFWFVSAEGRRLPLPASAITTSPTQLVVTAAAPVTARFRIDPAAWIGEPLGNYTLFVDLRADRVRDRVPSTTVPWSWSFAAAEVGGLLTRAASGQRTGLRNDALKLLRVYLGEFGPTLASIGTAGLPPAALKLHGELLTAGAIKPVAPKPGPVDLQLEWEPTTGLRWVHPDLRRGLEGQGTKPSEQFARVLAVRRHLGWEPLLGFVAAPELPMGAVAGFLSDIRASLPELQSPRLLMTSAGTNQTGLALSAEAPGEGVPTVRISGADAAAVQVRTPEGWSRLPGTLSDWAASIQETPGRTFCVEIAPALKWREVEPLLRQVPTATALVSIR